jgi:CO/xanthine dehydrogenase FAD-binding subunit
MFTTALAPDEILVEVELPALPEHTGCAFEEFSRRRGDYALMGIACRLHADPAGNCDDARLVFLNAGDGPAIAREAGDLLTGRPIDAEAAHDAALRAAEKEIQPLGNLHATPAFQRHLARVLAQRTILAAWSRATNAAPIER